MQTYQHFIGRMKEVVTLLVQLRLYLICCPDLIGVLQSILQPYQLLNDRKPTVKGQTLRLIMANQLITAYN